MAKRGRKPGLGKVPGSGMEKGYEYPLDRKTKFEAKALLCGLVTGGADQFRADMATLDPKDRAVIYVKLLAMLVPTEVKGEVRSVSASISRFTFEVLDARQKDQEEDDGG